MDEPIAGVAPALAHDILKRVIELKERGITFLIVEHRVQEIAKITNKWIGLKLGEKIHDALTVSEYSLKDIFL